MAFWMKPLTIMGLFCSQLSDLLPNCISFIVERLLVKYIFFVMYFLICFWGNASSTINRGKQMKLLTDWNLIPLLFSPHFTAQCLTCRQCPIGIFGTCFLSKDVTCTNTNQSCFRGDARKETFFSSIVKVFRQRKLRTEETHKEKQKYFPSLFEWQRLIEQNQIFQVKLLH